MGISQKDMINSLSNLLNWLEQEKEWGTNSGELKFITGRIGELYTAIMTNGQMAEATNQNEYDVVSEENQRISVKSKTRVHGSVMFNSKTLHLVDRIVIVHVDVEETTVKIIYDGTLDEAWEMMTFKNGKSMISISKIKSKSKQSEKTGVISYSAAFEDYVINRLESGKIEVYQNKQFISPSKSTLRQIARKIGVDKTNLNGNDKNQRQLGYDIIRQLS